MYYVLCMLVKDRILKTLKDFGRIPTSRVAGIVGMNTERARALLEELLKEKKVKKIQETNATYWEKGK